MSLAITWHSCLSFSFSLSGTFSSHILFYSLWCAQPPEKYLGTMCQRHNIINGMNQVCQLPYERTLPPPHTTFTLPIRIRIFAHKPNPIEKITCHISLRRRRQTTTMQNMMASKEFHHNQPAWICSSLSIGIVNASRLFSRSFGQIQIPCFYFILLLFYSSPYLHNFP